MLELAASATDVDEHGLSRAVVLAAVDALDPDAIDALARLALAATPLALDTAALRVLMNHRLVAVDDDGRARLRHDLVGDAAITLIGDDRRRAIHLDLARHATDAGARARHFDAAGETDDALEWARVAAGEATT